MVFLKRPPPDIRRRMRYGSGFFVALGVAALAYDILGGHAAPSESIIAAVVLIVLSGTIFWHARD